jgi:hypothetical protein
VSVSYKRFGQPNHRTTADGIIQTRFRGRLGFKQDAWLYLSPVNVGNCARRSRVTGGSRVFYERKQIIARRICAMMTRGEVQRVVYPADANSGNGVERSCLTTQ